MDGESSNNGKLQTKAYNNGKLQTKAYNNGKLQTKAYNNGKLQTEPMEPETSTSENPMNAHRTKLYQTIAYFLDQREEGIGRMTITNFIVS